MRRRMRPNQAADAAKSGGGCGQIRRRIRPADLSPPASAPPPSEVSWRREVAFPGRSRAARIAVPGPPSPARAPLSRAPLPRAPLSFARPAHMDIRCSTERGGGEEGERERDFPFVSPIAHWQSPTQPLLRSAQEVRQGRREGKGGRERDQRDLLSCSVVLRRRRLVRQGRREEGGEGG